MLYVEYPAHLTFVHMLLGTKTLKADLLLAMVDSKWQCVFDCKLVKYSPVSIICIAITRNECGK